MRVENYINVMMNPFFPQLFVLMAKVFPRVLVAKLHILGVRCYVLSNLRPWKKFILVWKFAFSNLMVCDSRPIKNFATKSHGEASRISASNGGKIGGINIIFRLFSTLMSYPILYEKSQKKPQKLSLYTVVINLALLHRSA